MATTLGVGFLGAGPVTQAIHVPVLATMPDRFHVASVMDVDAEIAAKVADRCGAKAETTAEATIEDPSVDILAICSPNSFHADQVIAACEAGKRAILCEKPLAVGTEEARRIRSAVQRYGTPVMVGTMHAYDPAYRAAKAAWMETGNTARFVQSAIYLPGNDVFINQATDQRNVGTVRRGGGDGRAFSAHAFEAAILGLGIHNVPLVRHYYPSVGEVRSARHVKPFGYSVVLANGDQNASLQALMPGDWSPKWRFKVIGERAQLSVEFPPSYVLSGSGRATLVVGDTARTFSFGESGYEIQWRHLHDVVAKQEDLIIPFDVAANDLEFALSLARSGSEIIGSAA
jgi:predicted dehydrogenase